MSESRSPFTVVVEDSGPLYSEFNHRVMVRASPLLLWCPSFRLPPGVSDSDKPRPLYQSKYRHHHLDRLDRFAVIHYRSPYLATSLLFTFIFPLSASASLHLSGSHDPSPALPLRSLARLLSATSPDRSSPPHLVAEVCLAPPTPVSYRPPINRQFGLI